MYYYYDITTGAYVGCGLSAADAPTGCEVRTTPPAPAPKTNDEIIKELTAAVQAHLDTKARERNYDGIFSLCSYAPSTDPKFGPEGRSGSSWRDACWSTCNQVMADCLAGIRATPTADQLIAELPLMVWP